MNLEALTLPELLEIKKQLPALIAQRQAELRLDVLRKAQTLAAKHGLTLEDLIGKGRRHRPKYHNPADPAQTWSGVGSRPRWVREWIEAGRDLSELLISGESKSDTK